MGCACGKKKGSVSVFSTEEQARIAKSRSLKVQTTAGPSRGSRPDWDSANVNAEPVKTG